MQASKLLSLYCTNINIFISKINTSFNQSSLISPTITILLNPLQNTIEYNSNPFSISPITQIYNTSLSLTDIDNMVTILRKEHLVNSHISFTLIDISCEISICEFKSSSLIITKMRDVINIVQSFFSKKIDIDNNTIISQLNDEENNVEYDICIIFHNYLPQSAIDIFIYDNRAYQFDFPITDIISYINKRNFCFIKEKNVVTTYKKNTSISYLIIINYRTKGLLNLNDGIYKGLEKVKEELNSKVKAYIEKLNISNNIQNIISSMMTIFHSTPNEILYNKLKKLFPNDSTDDMSSRLYSDFIKQ